MILGCVAFQYFKGTLVKAFATIIVAICASVVAFAYFEVLANVLISRGESGSLLSLAPWAQSLCFVLIFVLAFAILQTVAVQLMRHPVDLGFVPERIGRVVCGIFLGFITSGLLLTALEMAPLPTKWPYQRFDPTRLEAENPSKVLLNADGLATGLFSVISNGSFSGKISFATLHPNYLDQLFLNRLIGTGDTSIISSISPAIEVPKPAVWPASKAIAEQVDLFVQELKTRGGKLVYDDQAGTSVSVPVSPKSGYDPTIVRVGIRKRAIRGDAAINGGAFTPSQLRLICTRKGYGEDRLAGEAVNIYPIAYLKAADKTEPMRPEIKIATSDFDENSNNKFIDFVFCVPGGFEPVLVQFKLNSIAEIPLRGGIVSADKAPPPVFFSPSVKSNNSAKRPAQSSSPPKQQETTSGRRGLSDFSRSIVGDDFDDK
jgi:hypothetical protein